LTGLDGLRRAAVLERDTIERARRARRALLAAKRRLERREAELARLAAEAAALAARLEASRSERARALAAAAAVSASSSTAPSATAAAAPAPAEPAGPRTLTVTTTGYALRGSTATGIQATSGVAAVDPSVIPLGTRLLVPGYGPATAADTGGAVRGAHIDLWFPTRAEALAWGTRVVVITLPGA
jgi:3D (Asp-Asp-Asp) domain-containing protein